MSPVGFYGSNQTGYYARNRQQRLPAPRAVDQTSKPPVQFGLAMLSTYVADQTAKILFYTAWRGIIDEVEFLPVPDDLEQNDDFKYASKNVQLSNKEEDQGKELDYLDKAEEAYKKAAVAQDTNKDFLAAATCWMSAAECAKKGKKGEGVVNMLCEDAGNAFERSRAEILEERAELMKPYNLNQLVRLILGSIVSTVFPAIYKCSLPNGTAAQKSRSYIIKFSYGQDELARVQRNEKLAEQFNDSKVLLNTISSLHSNRKWQMADYEPILPIQVPLPLSGFGSCLKQTFGMVKQTFCKAITPRTPTGTATNEKSWEDMV